LAASAEVQRVSQRAASDAAAEKLASVVHLRDAEAKIQELMREIESRDGIIQLVYSSFFSLMKLQLFVFSQCDVVFRRELHERFVKKEEVDEAVRARLRALQVRQRALFHNPIANFDADSH
jgi:hypothetical protein